jgi:hypothetical protein
MRREQAGEDYRFAPEGEHPVPGLRQSGPGETPGYTTRTEAHSMAYSD